jgi:hypothetical protein
MYLSSTLKTKPRLKKSRNMLWLDTQYSSVRKSHSFMY